MTQINIPKTIESAKAALGELGSLVTAKQWERAAIVYAFTQPPTEGRPKKLADTGQYSFTDFAALGIVGLTKRHTVAEYREAWQWAIDNGMGIVALPGAEVTLPIIDWPPGFIDHGRGRHATGAEIEKGVREMIAANPEKIIETLIETNRATLVDAIAEKPALGDEVTEATAAVRAARGMPRYTDPEVKIDHTLGVVINALDAFWTRTVLAGDKRVTFQQVVETVVENTGSPSLRSRVAPTAHMGNSLIKALGKHIDLSSDIRDGKTLTTGKALVATVE